MRAGDLVINKDDATASQFLIAPPHSRWEYQVDGGQFSFEVPDFARLNTKQKVVMRLVADANYILDIAEPVETKVIFA